MSTLVSISRSLVARTGSPFLVLGTSMLLPAPTSAQTTINTDRPGITYSPVVMEPGRFQVELGLPNVTFTRGAGADSELWNVPLLVRYGATKDLELRLGGTTWNRLEDHGATTDGFGDVELGAKIALVEGGGSTPKTSAVATVRLPTGDDDFTSSQAGYSLNIAGDWDIGDGNLLRGLLGATRTPSGDTNATTGAIGILFGHTFDARWSGYVEVGWFPEIENSVNTAVAGGGAACLLNENTQLDVFADFGLNSDTPDANLGVGVSFRF